jgi:hypothetical protein
MSKADGKTGEPFSTLTQANFADHILAKFRSREKGALSRIKGGDDARKVWC